MADQNEAKFVEIEGKKYAADEADATQPKKDDKGNLVPFEEKKPDDETNLVKHLRGTIEAKDAEIKRLAEQAKGAESATETAKLTEQVQKLSFENQIARKLPQFADKSEEIYEIQKKFPNASFDEVIAQYVGKSVIEAQEKGTQGHALKTKPISVTTNEPKLEEKTDAELLEIAKQEFRA